MEAARTGGWLPRAPPKQLTEEVQAEVARIFASQSQVIAAAVAEACLQQVWLWLSGLEASTTPGQGHQSAGCSPKVDWDPELSSPGSLASPTVVQGATPEPNCPAGATADFGPALAASLAVDLESAEVVPDSFPPHWNIASEALSSEKELEALREVVRKIGRTMQDLPLAPGVHLDDLPDLSEDLRWSIQIDRTSGQALGLDVRRNDEGGMLEVKGVRETGLVAIWNRDNPDRAVQVGDLIVQANDAQERTSMLDTLKKMKPLDISMVRKAALADLEQERARLEGVIEELMEAAGTVLDKRDRPCSAATA